jgi:hypothetical protein
MTRLRFSIAQLMGIVLYLGFGFAALRNADEFWASASYTLAIILIAGSLAGAPLRRSFPGLLPTAGGRAQRQQANPAVLPRNRRVSGFIEPGRRQPTRFLRIEASCSPASVRA